MIIGNKVALGAENDSDVILSEGLKLASNNDLVLYEDNEGTRITMGDMMSRLEANDWIKSGTAIMLENTRKYFANMDETTRLVNVGDFQKYAFPLVKALFPSLAAHELASVQAMPGPVSLVFFMKFIYNLTKGTAVAGQDIIENPNESYSSDLIDQEQLGTGDGATAQFTGNLAFTPVSPGTVELTSVVGAAAVSVTDDGNGNLVGDIGAASTIDYVTGAFDVTFVGNIDNGEAVNAQYSYDNEANDQIPSVDLTLTSSPVTAVTRKLRTRWSVEAHQDLKNLYNVDAEVEQTAAIASEIKFEIDREVVRDIKNITVNSVSAFSKTPPSNLSFTEHKLLFIDKLLEMSNSIFTSTQRAVGTWLIGGTNVANLVESLPGFKPYPKPPNTRGIYKSGVINGSWDFWKDPLYPGSAVGSTDNNGMTMGYKGESMWEVGYIFAPYILAYTTALVMLDDFIGRKGIASRYGKKAVDGRFFCKGSITGNTFA